MWLLEEFSHQLLESQVEFARATTGLAKRQPPWSTYSRRIFFSRSENSGALCPLKNRIRARSSSGSAASAESTTCHVNGRFQSRETNLTRLLTSTGSWFQSPRGGWFSLLIRTGPPPLARNIRRVTRCCQLGVRVGSPP